MGNLIKWKKRQPRRLTSWWRVWLILLCLTKAGLAQYRFDHWTAETGLPQNIISAIRQTPEGYIWIATLDGLARFDGVRFTVFNKSNTPGISNNRFTSLYQDVQGDLWLGTEVGVVTHYHQGQFTTYTTEQGLPKSFAYGITGDGSGRIWVFSANKIRQWERTTGRFIEIDTPQFSGGSGDLGWVSESGLWGADQAGLHFFIAGVWSHYALPISWGRQFTRVVKEQDGTVWAVAAGEKLYQLRDGKARLFPRQHARPDQLMNSPSMVERPMMKWRDHAGKIWTLGIGRNLTFTLIIPSSGRLETKGLNCLYEDRDGNLWVGADGQGLYRIRKQIVTTYSQEQGLINRNVYPVYEDRAGTIWVGAWDGGLSQIKQGKVTNFTPREGLSAGAVTAFFEDKEGRFWIASHNDLQTFEHGRFTSVKAQFTPDQAKVNVIHQDQKGAMWFGTDHGVIRYENGNLRHFTFQDGLPGDSVRVILDAAGGGLWIGCYGGLMRWQDGKFTTWTEQEKLPGNAIRALYEDKDGVLWIGTYDSGLGRFKDGKFTHYTTREGLFNDGVFQILEDAYGNLWMSSNRGIYRVRKQELNEFAAGQRRDVTSIAFGKSDGMLNVECNGGLWPAGTRSRDGRLWFPTQDGVVVIDPKAVTTNQEPPPILIEAFLLDRVPIAFDHEVRIQPGQENFEIQYTALSFANAEYLRFKYKIEGFNDDWIDAGTRRSAFYSHLPPGDYRFRVIAANSDGVWNEEGKSLRIVVVPPFYRRWWLLLLSVVALASAVTLAFRYRIRQLQRAQLAQQQFSQQLIESQEAERKRIAGELHDSLGQNLIVIKNWATLGLAFTAPDAPVREQLDEISTTALQSLNDVRSIIHNLRPYQLDTIGLSNTLRFMIEQVSAASGLQFQSEIAALDNLFAPEAEVIIFRIVQECVNNIVKHAQATEAKFLCQIADGNLQMTIADNGRGLSPSPSPQSSGLGLTGLRERVRILGGTHKMQSAAGQGTTHFFTIPIPVSNTAAREENNGN